MAEGSRAAGTDHPYAAELVEANRTYLRRILGHLQGGSSDLAPAPMTNKVKVYTDPLRHQRERQVLFRETPQLVCLSRDLHGTGAFRLFDETGVPVLVTRTKDGAVRAFLNVCRHRGASLCKARDGNASRFTCGFHGWTYSNEGRLLAAPEAERFAGGMAGREQLVELAAEERHGLVFVMPTPGRAIDLSAHLGPFDSILRRMNLAAVERVKEGILPVAANWKYALDTYGEGYHFAALHKATLAPFFRSDITIYDRYGLHHRVAFVERGLEALLDKPESEWPIRAEAAGIHYLFPNVILFAGSVSPGKLYLTTFRHYPGETPGETVTHKAIYAFGGVKSPEHRVEIEAAFDATAHVVCTEDYAVAEEGWKNLTALDPEDTVVYGRQELALQDVQRSIAAAIGMPL